MQDNLPTTKLVRYVYLPKEVPMPENFNNILDLMHKGLIPWYIQSTDIKRIDKPDAECYAVAEFGKLYRTR